MGLANTPGDTTSHAFLYSGWNMTDLGTLGGTWSLAYGINDSGQVVGWVTTAFKLSLHVFLIYVWR